MCGSEDAAAARVRGLFPSLAADAATKWRYDESPYFGDYAVTATYRNVEIRLVHERESDFADIRPSGCEEWFDLALLRALMTGGDAAAGAKVEELSSFLEERNEDILTALDREHWKTTEARLKRMEKESAKRRFGYEEKD